MPLNPPEHIYFVHRDRPLLQELLMICFQPNNDFFAQHPDKREQFFDFYFTYNAYLIMLGNVFLLAAGITTLSTLALPILFFMRRAGFRYIPASCGNRAAGIYMAHGKPSGQHLQPPLPWEIW
jgi:hypothetical protein